MFTPHAFVKTKSALQLLAGPRRLLAVPRRMLLINVDGRRGVPELLDIAGSLGLGVDALDDLQRDGLITAAGTSRPVVMPVAR